MKPLAKKHKVEPQKKHKKAEAKKPKLKSVPHRPDPPPEEPNVGPEGTTEWPKG